MRKYNINIEVFTNPQQITPSSVYLLGLLWADGNLGNSNSITITCIKSDLKDINKIIKSTGNWGIFYRTPKGRRQRQQTFYVANKEFYQFLSKNGYKAKSIESATRILSFIPSNLQLYWWRGFLDGDGCIYGKEHKNHTGKKYPTYCVFFTSSLNQDWSFIDLLPIDLNWKTIERKTTKGSYSRRLLNNKTDCINLLNFIYNDYNNIGFTRKYKLYLNMKRNFENGRPTISKEKVLKIRETFDKNPNLTFKEASLIFNCGPTAIRNIIKRQTHKNI